MITKDILSFYKIIYSTIMELIFGKFNSLEKEFLKYVEKQKKSALDKILIIAPSGRLCSYLREKLANEHNIISNIFFTNLNGLFFSVDNEFFDDKKPLMKDRNLQDFIIKNILADNNFKQSETKGFSEGIKSTLRDLTDSGVEPNIVEEFAKEKMFGENGAQEDNDYMLWLNGIYRQYLAKTAELKDFRSYREFFEDVSKNVEKSSYLSQFEKIIFYGFYDFTGLQLEIFEKILDKYPAVSYTHLTLPTIYSV